MANEEEELHGQLEQMFSPQYQSYYWATLQQYKHWQCYCLDYLDPWAWLLPDREEQGTLAVSH